MAPGRGILKVCGILLIIFASIGVLMGLISILGRSAMESNTQMLEILEQQGTPYDSQAVLFGGMVALVIGVIEIVVGIVGIANCNRTDKAQLCFIAGIAALLCELGNALYSAVTAEFNVWSLIFTAVALVLPVLFIWGSLKNKEAGNQ